MVSTGEKWVFGVGIQFRARVAVLEGIDLSTSTRVVDETGTFAPVV